MKEILTFMTAIGVAAYGVKRLTNDQDILARTIWGEARADDDKDGRPDEMEAVACVIMNRYRSKKYGSSVAAVCLKEYQFSVWNNNDPNRVKLLVVTDRDPQFKQAVEIAGRAIAGTLPDITKGATHYHTITIKKKPDWADQTKLVGVVGNHAFYSGIA